MQKRLPTRKKSTPNVKAAGNRCTSLSEQPGGLAVCPECGGPDLALPGADVDGGVRHCVHMLAEPGGRDPVPGGSDLHHRGGSFGVCLHGSHRGAANPPL